MKKIIAVIACLALVFALCTTVSAEAGINQYEKEVLDLIKELKTPDKNGAKFDIPDEFPIAAENYFNTIDMTEQQKNTIVGYINSSAELAREELKSSVSDDNNYYLKNLKGDSKKKILQNAKDAALAVDCKLVYNPSTNKVTITKNGTSEVLIDNAAIVKVTGEDFPITAVAVASGVAVLVIGGAFVLFVISKKKGLFVK